MTFSHKNSCLSQRGYLVVDDWDIGSRGEGHSSDATDVFSKLSPHLQPSITREGPQHGVD